MSTELIFAGIPAGIALIAAIAAVCSAREARSANKRADKANELAVQANEKAAEANEISKQALEEQKRQAPPPWSSLEKCGGEEYRLRNLSGRELEIVELAGVPEALGKNLTPYQLPLKVMNGDSIPLFIPLSLAVGTGSVDINWRYCDDPNSKIQVTRRNVY